MNYKCPPTVSVGSFQKLNKLLEQLRAASASTTAPSASASLASSSGASMISKYMRTVRGELRLQHPEGREAWLKAEMDSMIVKRGNHDKPSLLDVWGVKGI